MSGDSIAFSVGTAAGSALTFGLHEYAGDGPVPFALTALSFAMLYGYVLVTLERY